MIATPLKHPGIHLSSETSSQRRNMPMHAVFFDSIPAGTLTPVKDLAKYQNPSLKLNDHEKTHCLEMTNFNNKKIFHSTMLAETTSSNSSLDISVIKPNKDRLKNKANYESPGKIFQRMKEKVLRDKQEQTSGNSSLLEPLKSEKKIFTPKGDEKRVLQNTCVCEEKENNKSLQSDNISPRVQEVPLESSNSTFVPIKQKIQCQQEKKAPLHNLTYEIPFLNQEHENVSAAGFSNKTLPRTQLDKQILHSKENTFVTTKSKKDTFVLEGVDSIIEKSQNTTVETLNTNCVPVKNDDQLMVSDSKVATKRTSQQEIKEGNENSVPRETDLLGSMNDTCKIVLATPRFHITIPQKSKRNASNHSLPSTPQTLSNEVKEIKVVQLQEWMIKVINNNTAICVEGKLTDITNIYWHSNVIIERIKHNKLKTLSGNIYILKGMIDRISMKEAGYPNYLIRKFMFGFPEKWKEHIDNFLEQLRACEKKERKARQKQKTGKFISDVQKSAKNNARENQTDVLQRASTTYDIDCCHLELKNGKRRRLPAAPELNVCHDNCQNKPRLRLSDDQMHNTCQNGGENDLTNQEIIGMKAYEKLSSKKLENCERTNERIIKSQKQERTEESNVSIDILTLRQPFFLDEERKCMALNPKEAYILMTPLKSKKVIEQKCMKYNLSYSTIKAVTDFAVPKHQKESKSDLNETTSLISKPTKTFKNAFEFSEGHESKNKEDCSECDLLTVNQKIKISSPKKEQMVTSDFKKNARLLPKSKKIKNVSMSFYKQQSSSDLSSEESETEKGIRRKAAVAKKNTARNTEETVVHLRKSTRNTTRKIPVISESETEESESEFYIKQKKARCSAKENLQKSGIRNEFPVIEAIRSDETNRHPFECFPGLIQDEEWNEKELQKLHWDDCDKYVFRMQKEHKSKGGIVWGNIKKKTVETEFSTPTSRKKTLYNKELGEHSGIGKLFTNAMESLDEEEKDYYFSNSDSA
ncbi:mis18-binding protein 1 isoform X5 [Leopardus geoffroyi]|uniref:mis18-binding protein 1 isoform X5 n=1 Tax=Leopardus geoffroyi TaxID=46844 RepID=UPI001E264103|nr:mis18-binding protein 1 isoform X5 [Leopardus geoffroyi]